jgi:hypothetical protein
MDITPWGIRSLGTLRDSCKGALETGEPRGRSFAGTFERKESISGFLFSTRRSLRF